MRTGITYEPFKYGFGIVLFLALGVMWLQRGFIVDSYQGEQEQIAINLTGIDLTVERADVGESPYQLAKAPDTAKNPLSLAFADDENQEDEAVEVEGGEATLSGKVLSGTTPVPRATVRLERHTSEGFSAPQDVRASASGQWSISGLHGGRYRIRAWSAGRFAMDKSVVLFLEDGKATPLNLQLREVEELVEFNVYSGGSIYQGLTGSAVISVTERTVDEEGFITTRPVPGKSVKVTAEASLKLLSTAEPTSNSNGEILVRLRCDRVGAARILVEMDETLKNVTLPPCITIPPPPTAPPTTARPTTQRPTTERPTTSSASNGSTSAPTTTTPSGDR